MQRLIDANRKSSASYGWRPEDFGASAMDQQLAAAIKAFQIDRILDPTGIVDRKTFRAMQAAKEAAALAEEDAPRHHGAFHIGLGRNDADKIAAFVGVRLHLPRSVWPTWAGLADLDPPGSLVCDVQWADRLPADPKRVIGFAWVPTRSDQLPAVVRQVEAMAAKGVGGITIGLADRLLDQDAAQVAAAVGQIQAAAGSVHTAIALRVDPFKLPRGRREVMKALNGRFYSAAPFVHPDFGGYAPESYVGRCLSVIRAYMGIRMSRCFPMFALDGSSDPVKIQRSRQWLRDRHHRGHGFMWPVPANLIDAAFGQLPDHVSAVDPPPADLEDP